jgi:hypothetical protein
MIISDFLSIRSELLRFAAQPEMDALNEADALQECQLLDVGFDAVRGDLGLIFELRTALQLREGNTGLIVASGVLSLAWHAEHQSSELIARTVLDSKPTHSVGQFHLSLGLWPRATFEFDAREAAFFVGNVRGLPDAPPDYVDGDYAAIRSALPSWNSPFDPVHATFSRPLAVTVP